MGQSFPEGKESRVEALEPGEPADDRRPMLYSAEALRTIEAIRERLGRVLKEHALGRAKQTGRRLVTDDDVWAALDSIRVADIYSESDEEAVDG